MVIGDQHAVTPYRVTKSKPRLRLFTMGESGGTSCFNDDAVIGLRNLVTERDKTKTTSVWFQIGVPKVNQDFICLQKIGVPKVNQDLSVCKKWGLQSKPGLVCLLWGEGERRYELPITLWVPKIKAFILGKRRYMSPNDARHQSLRPCYRTRRHRSMRPYC